MLTTATEQSFQGRFQLDGKVVLLTGASAGLGRRFAQVLTEAGARVALVARRRELLRDLEISLPGSRAFPRDLAAHESVQTLVADVEAELGAVDVLVNNAAWIAGGVRAENETLEQIHRTIAINMIAPVLLGQACWQSMSARGGGVIVNVTSMVAHVGIGRFPQATYAATKGALEALSREWAVQWSPDRIRVNCLAPGFFASEMTAPVIDDVDVQKWITRNTLIPRSGVPEDFDGALLFLASDASAYVTGQTVVVDGGWTAR